MTIFDFINFGLILFLCLCIGFAIYRISKEKTTLESVAAHEAGHALFLAAYDIQPNAVILVWADRGLVSFPDGEYESHPNYIDFVMLRALAGYLAENKIMKNFSRSGNVQDNWDWYSYYYKYKENDKHNFIKKFIVKQKTRSEQERKVKELIGLNLELLLEIQNFLLANNFINAKDISHLLAKVQFPQNFPKLSKI